MLDMIRTHKRLMLLILVLLVFPSFVFWGIQSSHMSSGSAGEVAKIAGMPITKVQLDAYLKARVSQIMDENPGIDPQVFETAEFKQVMLNRMILGQLQSIAAQDSRLFISDYALRGALLQDPNIRSLLKPDGSLDVKEYEALLQRNGLQPQRYEENVRARVMEQRLMSAVSGGFVSQTEIDQFLQILGEKYVIRQQLFVPADFTSQVKLSDEDLKQYYEQHQNAFKTDEFASIEYVVFDAEKYMAGKEMPESTLREYYEQNLSYFTKPEQRRASHILIEVDPDAPLEQQEQGRARAQQLLDTVRQDPTKFAEVAKASSDDKSSATAGGDLGFFGRKAMVQSFEDAVFTLQKEGDISDLVITPFGYHIIMLTGIKAAEPMPFEQVKADIEKQLHAQWVEQQFAQVAREFRNDVNAGENTLKTLADKYGLTVEKAERVTPTPPAGASGVFASPAFLTAAFAPQAREGQQNTAAVEITPTQLATARVVAYTPAQLKPYEEVQAQVKAMATQEKAVDLARAAGEEALKAWQQSPEQANSAPELTITRQLVTGVAPQTASEVFRLSSAAQLPQSLGVNLNEGGYALVQLQRVDPADPVDASTRAMIQSALMQQSVNAQEQAYMNYLQTKYDVKVFAEALRASGQ